MSARGIVIALGCLAIVPGGKLAAQGLEDLVAAGRYEDAAALLADADPQSASIGAELIFNHAYQEDYLAEDWPAAIRGFTAAKRVPHLNERDRQRLDFWHAMALYNSVRTEDREPADLPPEALPILNEAVDLLIASRDYAAGINMVSMLATVTRAIDAASQPR
jgi:hypothetical protein